MSRRPAAVIFDLGKVLVDFDYGRVVRRVADRSDAGPEALQQLLMASPLLPAFERGALTSQGFYEAIRKETGYQGSFEEFAESFADIFTEIPPMIELQAELRRRQVPTFIFSNTNDIAIPHIRQRFPFFSGFDGYVLSYEHGSMKPDAPLYEVVERMSGCQGDALLYLDDLAPNVATGAARGWQAVQHLDPVQTRAAVQATGLLD